MLTVEYVPKKRANQEMKVKDILRFINPCDSFHSPSLFRLRLLAEYGPLDDGKVLGGVNVGRAITVHEMHPILESYKEVTDKILFDLQKEGLKGVFRHPMNHQVLPLLKKYLRGLNKTRLSYRNVPFTLETVVDFDDLSIAVEQYYTNFVRDCVRTKSNLIA